MKLSAPEDALARLDPGARLPAPGPRVRLGVGAAVVLLITAMVTAVIVSILSQPVRRSEVAVNNSTAASSNEVSGVEDDGASGAGPGGVLIFVHVLGAVRHPGLFELHPGARVMDAVAAAGGLTENADPAGVNLARVLGDGEQLYVPQLGEAQPGAPPGAPSNGAVNGGGGAPVGPLDLNTATVAELDTLPRIGPALAQRIVDYRDANGRFSSVDDLRNVTGIGEKTFDGLKDLVRV